MVRYGLDELDFFTLTAHPLAAINTINMLDITEHFKYSVNILSNLREAWITEADLQGCFASKAMATLESLTTCLDSIYKYIKRKRDPPEPCGTTNAVQTFKVGSMALVAC